MIFWWANHSFVCNASIKNISYLLSLVAKLKTAGLQENVWLACSETIAYRRFNSMCIFFIT